MPLVDITSLSGVSQEIARFFAKKGSNTLEGNAASIFLKIDTAVQDVLGSGKLSFAKIYQSIYKIAVSVKEYFSNNYMKIVKFCKNLANVILKKQDASRAQAGGREELVEAARGYIGTVNNRNAGNLLFSNGRDEEWCADTVSTIVKDICGDRLPKDFGSPSVSVLRQWGINNDAYIETSVMDPKKRAQYILTNIKPGDIMIEKRNKSHTGIVTEVYVSDKDGKVHFKVVEGNMGSKTASERRFDEKDYAFDSKTLSGFIRMGKWLEEPEST